MSNPREERPAAGEYLPYYGKYIALVAAGDIVDVLQQQLEQTHALVQRTPAAGGKYAYAEGKWTMTQVLGHVADAERVFAYRALRFARADETPLPGWDENAWQPPAGYDQRTLGDVLEEFTAVRHATIAMLRGLPAAAWTRGGIANDAAVTVRALAAMIAGHELHHRRILEERYLPALP